MLDYYYYREVEIINKWRCNYIPARLPKISARSTYKHNLFRSLTDYYLFKRVFCGL